MKNFSEKNQTIYYQVIPHYERLYLWYKYCNKLINYLQVKDYKRVYIFDLREDFIKKGFQHFMNHSYEDHHPNFLKTKEYIINYLNEIKFFNDNNKIIN